NPLTAPFAATFRTAGPTARLNGADPARSKDPLVVQNASGHRMAVWAADNGVGAELLWTLDTGGGWAPEQRLTAIPEGSIRPLELVSAGDRFALLYRAGTAHEAAVHDGGWTSTVLAGSVSEPDLVASSAGFLIAWRSSIDVSARTWTVAGWSDVE